MNLDNVTHLTGLEYVFIENGIAVKQSITFRPIIAATAIIRSHRALYIININRSDAQLSHFIMTIKACS